MQKSRVNAAAERKPPGHKRQGLHVCEKAALSQLGVVTRLDQVTQYAAAYRLIIEVSGILDRPIIG
jgi:hypothetical protein